MICKNKDEEISLEEFWDRLQQLVPPGGEISWEVLWKEFGRNGIGFYTGSLVKKGFIQTTYRGYIKINERKRGEKIV